MAVDGANLRGKEAAAAQSLFGRESEKVVERGSDWLLGIEESSSCHV